MGYFSPAWSERRGSELIDAINCLSPGNCKMFILDCIERIIPDLIYCISNLTQDNPKLLNYDIDNYMILCRSNARGLISNHDPSITAMRLQLHNLNEIVYQYKQFRIYVNLWNSFCSIVEMKSNLEWYHITGYIEDIRRFLVDKFIQESDEKAIAIVNAINPTLINNFSKNMSIATNLDISDLVQTNINAQLIRIVKRSITKGESKKINDKELDWQISQLNLYKSGVLSI